jgi:dUTP pyrophosphatase
MRVKLDEGAYLPERAHETDAGLDLRSRESKLVPAHGSALFDTGVHVELPSGTCGLLVSKSGLHTKWNLTSTGLVDEGYTGSIVVNLQNHSDMDYYVYKGDKITQMVIIPCLYEDCEEVDEIYGARGDNGFGSTGR